MANIILGFVIPQIDNAAHIGGLISGIFMTHLLLRVKPNQLVVRNISVAKRLAVFGLLAVLLAAGLVSSKSFLSYRTKLAYEMAEDPRDQFRYLTQILRVNPHNEEARLLRLELSLRYGNYSAAQADYSFLISSPNIEQKVRHITHKLRLEGKLEAVKFLEQLVNAKK